ncbi:MAG: DUF3800 domain-containing protein [Fibrobacterota bacterium]
MYLCYVDESGVPQIPGNTSHYVLCGISIPAFQWRKCDNDVSAIKAKWNLENTEIHTAWMLRPYLEQKRISGFEGMTLIERRVAVNKFRKADLLRLQAHDPKRYHQQKKNYSKTDPYIHLAHSERVAVVKELAGTIGKWEFARIFAECVDKVHFDPLLSAHLVDEQAFEQVVSRFEHYLQIMAAARTENNLGLIIHDNNQTSSKRMTELMVRFHRKGTFWTEVKHIIETPLFVDSSLTSMVQVADVCSYALRRYFENDESMLFDPIYKRADRKDGRIVGIRHFTSKGCTCQICTTRTCQ